MAGSLTKSCEWSGAPSWLGRWSVCGLLVMSLGSVTPVAAQEAMSTAANSPRLTASVNRPVLKLGSQGTEVSELQAVLQLLGYYQGKIDGIYSDQTAQAVAKFQSVAGVSADGIMGRETWNRLFPATPAPIATPAISKASQSATHKQIASVILAPQSEAATNPARSATPMASKASGTQVELPILKLGMRGAAVTGLQERLRAKGFFQGSADGVFGPQTHEAVKVAQQQYQLQPDGVVGPATWQLLLTK